MKSPVKSGITVILFCALSIAFASWMVKGVDAEGDYELRFFGKAGPKCCLYKLGKQETPATPSLR